MQKAYNFHLTARRIESCSCLTEIVVPYALMSISKPKLDSILNGCCFVDMIGNLYDYGF